MVMCNIHITMYQQKYCNSIFFFYIECEQNKMYKLGKHNLCTTFSWVCNLRWHVSQPQPVGKHSEDETESLFIMFAT